MPRIKLFTLDQAEKALPLVRRIAGDIVRVFGEREKRLNARRRLPLQPNPGSSAEEEADALEREMEAQETEILRYHEELNAIGVELKDFKLGLLDFYSRLDGRIVYLCWKLDDGPHLGWFHELSAGFRGRMPITPELRGRFEGLAPGETSVEL